MQLTMDDDCVVQDLLDNNMEPPHSPLLATHHLSSNSEPSIECSTHYAESDPSIESTIVTSSPSLRSTSSLDKRKPRSDIWCLFSFGMICFTLGVLSIFFPPFELLMNERLRMIKGFPAFEFWKNPPDEVIMRLFIFNITNKDAFLAGKEKLHMEEVGPWIFREKLRHSDVYFNSNNTMTYTAHRTAEFLPELSGNLTMDTPVVVANFGLLGMTSYLWDSSFLTKLGINMLMRQYKSEAIQVMRAGDYMWNNSDPLFRLGNKFLPTLVPTTNLGIMQVIYERFSDDVTVYMGVNHSRQFFLIDRWRGQPRLGYWDDERCDRAIGASEGVAYPQFITREDNLVYLRKTFCRATPLYYVRDQPKYGMNGFYYELPNDTFASGAEKPANACFRRRHDYSPLLPSGATDVSPCFYNFPIASSFPHFMHGSPELTEKVVGMNPHPEKHGSYVLVEPITGVPMESKARSQSNLVIRPLEGFSPRVMPFSNMTVPMFWAEYNQVGLPWYVWWLMYFAVEVVPPIQQPMCFIMVTGGMSLLLSAIFAWACYRPYYPALSPVNSTPNTRSYTSLNFISVSSVLNDKNTSLIS